MSLMVRISGTMALAVLWLLVGVSCREHWKHSAHPLPVERDTPGVKLRPGAEGPGPFEADPVVAVDSSTTDQAVRPTPLHRLPDTAFVRLADYSEGFGYEIRYATEDNFLKQAVYPCGECYTRAVTARALLAANEDFEKEGYRIRFFDCYRPNSVQYKMWEITPNPQYVANPVKGSIHNRGGAVDITLETLEGDKLPMGTDFDFFGPKAHHDHTALPSAILENRKLLKETMERHGFWSIRTEWWHYNLGAASRYPVSDWGWPCPDGEQTGG